MDGSNFDSKWFQIGAIVFMGSPFSLSIGSMRSNVDIELQVLSRTGGVVAAESGSRVFYMQ